MAETASIPESKPKRAAQSGLQRAEYRANIVDDIVLGDHDGLIAG